MKWKKLNERYEISEHGDVVCLYKMYKGGINEYNPFYIKKRIQDGYETVVMKNARTDNQIGRLVHRLVYETFIGEIEENYDVHHIDENRRNNHYTNLESILHSDHTKKHWDELKKKQPKRVEEKIKVKRDKTENKTYDMKAYQKKYREDHKIQK